MHSQSFRGCRAGQGGGLQLAHAPGRYYSQPPSSVRIDAAGRFDDIRTGILRFTGPRLPDLPGLDKATRAILADLEQPSRRP